jgi:hypothetical protein
MHLPCRLANASERGLLPKQNSTHLQQDFYYMHALTHEEQRFLVIDGLLVKWIRVKGA